MNIKINIEIPEGLKNDFESEQWTALSCIEMKNALKKGKIIKQGHWIKHPQGDQCSICKLYNIDHFNDKYCPSCGAENI